MFFDSSVNKVDLENKTLWYNILPLGEFYDRRYGKISISKEIATEIVTNFANGIPHYKPPVNIEHEDLLGAVGQIIELSLRDDGVYALIELTDEGAKLLSEKKFNYMSAEFVENYISKETGEEVGHVVVGVALTNRPAHLYVQPIQFSDINGNSFKGGVSMGDEKQKKPVEKEEVKTFSEEEVKALNDTIKNLSEKVKALSEELETVKSEKENLEKTLHEERVEKWLNEWREKGIPNKALEEAKKVVLSNGELKATFDATFTALADESKFKQLSDASEPKKVDYKEKAEAVAKTLKW
jgi:hypothetical protein